jgi:hypothetical protein
MLWQKKIDPVSARLIFPVTDIFLPERFLYETEKKKNICF